VAEPELTLETLLNQPTVSLRQSAKILGIGPWQAHKAVTEGTFPVPVIRVGRSIRVPTAPLRERLQIVDAPDPAV
jgi:hypothetical protein